MLGLIHYNIYIYIYIYRTILIINGLHTELGLVLCRDPGDKRKPQLVVSKTNGLIM